MADEPELQKGISSEWVTYLQQVLQQHGYWTGAADGEFGDELEHAVMQFQSAYGLPADGIVRAGTWSVLTGSTTSSSSSSDTHTATSDQPIEWDWNWFPEVMALVNAPTWDDYVRDVVGVDPAIFEGEAEPVA